MCLLPILSTVAAEEQTENSGNVKSRTVDNNNLKVNLKKSVLIDFGSGHPYYLSYLIILSNLYFKGGEASECFIWSHNYEFFAAPLLSSILIYTWGQAASWGWSIKHENILK